MAAKRVRIIDDEEPILEVLQGCLEELGNWEILMAASGQAGLQIARSELPDGILLDMVMPDMTGFETLQKLRDDALTKPIPVILLTARVQWEDQARLTQLEVAGVISKPFDPLSLVDQVVTAFGWSG